jgi:ABC-type transport system substrate-binding protein
MAPDGKTYTWKLRQNVPFYKDGKPTTYMLSAKDAIQMMELKAGFKSQNTRGAYTFFGTDKVDATIVNDHEFVVRLSRVNLDMAFLMTDEWATGVTSVDHWNAVGGEDGYLADPIGNGPWTLIELKNNEHSLLKRVENHYRQTPEFPEAEFVFSAEAATRLAMLLAKEVHISSIPRTIQQQAKDAGMVVAKSTLPAVHMRAMIPWYLPDNYINPTTGKPVAESAPSGPTQAYDANDPLRNIKVREALNLAVNRDQINQVFFKGEGFPLHDYFPQWRNDWKDSWAPVPSASGQTGKAGGWPYKYDPARAKQLLVEAGYPNGFETTLYAATNQPVAPEQAEIGEELKRSWEAIGIRVKLLAVPMADGIAVWRERKTPNHLWLSSWSLDPLCEAMSFISYNSGFGYWDWPEISTFLDVCATSTDVASRTQKASELGDWWHRNFTSVPIVWLFSDATYDPSVVQEYKVNMLHMGPIRHHEYTKAVYK